MKHINNYDTEINYYNKKSLNKKQYYNFYHGNFNFRKIENVSLTQQADITNNITETDNQTITYVDNNYLNNDKITAIVLNTVPSLTDNYIWIPETTDNVVPGLDSLLTYLQSKYATIDARQNAINNVNNTINNEIANIQTGINNIEISNPQNVSKESHYHTSHTDFMYQRNTTNNDNRKHIVLQNHYFTFQRQYNTNHLELQIQMMQLQMGQMQAQIDSLPSGGSGDPGGGGGDPDGIGTM